MPELYSSNIHITLHVSKVRERQDSGWWSWTCLEIHDISRNTLCRSPREFPRLTLRLHIFLDIEGNIQVNSMIITSLCHVEISHESHLWQNVSESLEGIGYNGFFWVDIFEGQLIILGLHFCATHESTNRNCIIRCAYLRLEGSLTIHTA